MTAAAWTFQSRMAVLRAVGAGDGPWAGWDTGAAGRTVEVSDAYAARQAMILDLRADGLLTEHNLLTAEGKALLAVERAHG
ncbi:hypothetical protein JIP62_10585 [Brevundimonas vitis]|uniref:Uncharacterized protein n=1 Tax=Brevundimonas vitisensis TaxID=2800818 RepID=A0ABX7BJP3_9CAUL|nr:hypothetical protein [Brevundimonas vitisensis]QQQ17779.1 hypothetical protein JIP62_10585 [Brevundimonas vitisensis]